MISIRTKAALILTATMLACGPARAQVAGIWDLPIGTPIAALPQDDFVEFACGTNGGPPSLPLEDFSQFDACRAEENGLFEVSFRYDDEAEYVARALQQDRLVEIYAGTRVYDYPVIASALFNPEGVLAGIRLVTDPRDTEFMPRHAFWALGNILMARHGEQGWECVNEEPTVGQNAVGQLYIDRSCVKQIGGLTASVEQRYYHRRGQSFTDPQTDRVRPTDFESMTLFQLIETSLLPEM